MKFPKFKGKAVLSPMAGVTDVAFRTLCKKYKAAITYTEFLSSTAIVRNNKKTWEMLKTSEIEKPVAVQLFGNNEKEVIQAAKNIQNNFDIIDINCGCPAWKVIRTGAGSELLKEPKKIANFINKLSSSINIPVSLKIRSGIDNNNINAIEVARLAEENGAAAIAIHGRTQKQGYTGTADWDIIKEIKEQVKIPVIGNGDIFTPEQFKEKLNFSKVDAIMIGRGAISNPYIFQQIEDYLKTNKYKSKDKKELFLEYLELSKEFNINYSLVKNHAISFTKGIEGGSKIRDKLAKVKSIKEIENIYDNF